MDITVYLPDETGRRAKEAEINLSAMLREAVIEELDRREAVANTLGQAKVHEVTVEDENGYAYDARLHGTELVYGEKREAVAYLLEDERLAVYDASALFYYDEDDFDLGPESEWLAQWFTAGEIVAALSKIGKKAVVDIGQAS